MKPRYLCQFCIYLLITSLLLPITIHCAEEINYAPKQTLVFSSRNKAKELGYRPITLYATKEKDIFITEGSFFSITNNSFALEEGDMIINVGDLDIFIPKNINIVPKKYGVEACAFSGDMRIASWPQIATGTLLKTGELGIANNGKFQKLSKEKITGDK